MAEFDYGTCSHHVGTPHADYPHHPGTLYDCYACESFHHDSAAGACVCDDCVGFVGFDMAGSIDFDNFA